MGGYAQVFLQPCRENVLVRFAPSNLTFGAKQLATEDARPLSFGFAHQFQHRAFQIASPIPQLPAPPSRPALPTADPSLCALLFVTVRDSPQKQSAAK